MWLFTIWPFNRKSVPEQKLFTRPWALLGSNELSPPPRSPLYKGLTVRIVETGGCDGGIRRSVWEGTVTKFVNAADLWPNSNFDKNEPLSIFAEIQVDPMKTFVTKLKGSGQVTVRYCPAMRIYWHKYEDGVWEYYT